LGQTTPEQYKRLQHDLGLDQPLYTQYWHWLSNAFHGDLGSSLVTKQSVTAAITQRFPITLSLMGGALLIAVVFGVLLGVISAVRGGGLGRVVDVVAMVGWVVPVYWIAAELVVIFAVKLLWLPATGYVTFAESPTGWLKSILLPVIAISIGAVGLFA